MFVSVNVFVPVFIYMYLYFAPRVDFDFEESLRLGLCASWPPGLLTVEDMNVRFSI